VFYPLDNNGEEPERCELVELEDSVHVTVIIRGPAPGVVRTDVGGYRAMKAEVELHKPLGARAVIDASCGETRRSLSTSRPVERGT
jgi:hypothetical protein